MVGEAYISPLDVSRAILRFLEINGSSSRECIRLGVGIDEHQCEFALAWLMYRELVEITDDYTYAASEKRTVSEHISKFTWYRTRNFRR